MTIILIKPNQLHSMAQSLIQKAKSIQNAINAVEKDINDLNSIVYAGNRASSLKSHYARVRNELLSSSTLIEKFASELENTAKLFEKADGGSQKSPESPISSPIIKKPIDPNSEFGQVLGAVDPNGELNQKPGIVDWLQTMFSFTKDLFGKVAAKNMITKCLGALGYGIDGAKLISSSNDISSTSAKYYEMLDLYGSSDPRTLAARHLYSSAELGQLFSLIDIPLLPGMDFMAKVGGKWDTLVDMYEQAKYEGPNLLDGMNIFNPPTVE
jgi:uncharacterized protein YukE